MHSDIAESIAADVWGRIRLVASGDERSVVAYGVEAEALVVGYDRLRADVDLFRRAFAAVLAPDPDGPGVDVDVYRRGLAAMPVGDADDYLKLVALAITSAAS